MIDHDALIAEMRGLREQVAGITGTVVAAVDGLLVAADTENGIDPDDLAAVAAAGLSIARRTAAVTDRGALNRTVAYSSRGYAAAYAVGDMALIVVLGDEGLDISQLHRESRSALERIGSILIKGE